MNRWRIYWRSKGASRWQQMKYKFAQVGNEGEGAAKIVQLQATYPNMEFTLRQGNER